MFIGSGPNPGRGRSSVDPLDELEGDSLGTLEEPQPPADVVHLVAEHLHPVGNQVLGDRLDVVDAEGEVVVAPSSPIRGMFTRIIRRTRIELEQLDLEVRLGSFECECDVLGLHVRHAHVSSRLTTVDRRDVLGSEAEQREELDRARRVRHRDGYVIGVAQHCRRLLRRGRTR